MDLPVAGKIFFDTNVLIDFLRAEKHTEWVLGGHGTVVRFISAIVLLELQLGADTPKRKKAVDRLHHAFPSERIIGLVPMTIGRAGHHFKPCIGLQLG